MMLTTVNDDDEMTTRMYDLMSRRRHRKLMEKDFLAAIPLCSQLALRVLGDYLRRL